MKLTFALAAILLPLSTARAAEGGRQELASPDGRVQLAFALGADGEPGYEIRYRGAPVLERSRLGFGVKDGPALARGFRVLGVERSSRDDRWRPVAGERAEIPDRCHALTVRLGDDQTSPRELRIEFRAYDEGIAFRYHFAGAGGAWTLTEELSEFRFAGDQSCWPTYTAQGVYARKPLSEVKPGCERPLVVELPGGRWAALGEAALVDFARLKLQPAGQPHTLRAHLHGPATVTLPGASPWRYLLLADSPGGLLERNFLRLNLNEPCALADTSWIKPGKVIREVTLTTTGGLACVEFAAKHGLQYIEFDAGWYGPENKSADASRVAVDPARSPGPLDLPQVIRHAKSNGVGVILYVNKLALSRQIDTLPALYRSWGVAGIKFGFVNVGSQADTRWLHEAIRKCATNHILVDIHDEFRSTGYERTYPNLLTVEGVRGDEETPGAAQDLATMFTRMLTGPADHTVCYFDRRVTNQWNHAYQLAKAVCFYSPWQFLYWYDRPPGSPARGGAGGSLPIIRAVPELAFYEALPTVWDETRVIQAGIGEYGAIARRRGEAWFIGVMNAGTNRVLQLPLNFLPPGRKYQAQRYSHDAALTTLTRVRLETIPVEATTVLTCILGPTDGQALHLRPAGN